MSDEDEEREELTEAELEEIAAEEVIDAEIKFFLQLLSNDYSPEDIARVAMDFYEEYENQFMCLDCEESVMEKREFFMVHEDLNKEIELDDGVLCVACYEKRLGRQLSFFDFTNAMTLISDGTMDHSDLLKNRLIAGLEETLSDNE